MTRNLVRQDMGAYWEPSKEEAIAAANNARSNLLNHQTTVAARAAAKAVKRARTAAAAAAAPAAESSIPPVAASIPTSAPVLTAGTLVRVWSRDTDTCSRDYCGTYRANNPYRVIQRNTVPCSIL